MTDVPDEVQRWTAKRKAAVVMSIVKGETSAAEAARKHGCHCRCETDPLLTV